MLVFVLALAVPALAQDNGAAQQQAPAAQSTQSGSSAKQTTTTTTTQKTTPTEVTRTTGIDPIWLAIGGIALITIIAIALLASRNRGRDRVATVRENTTVIKE
jgi:hypothetical protein